MFLTMAKLLCFSYEDLKMIKIYQGEDDSHIVIEFIRGKVYISDNRDDSVINICPESWQQIKDAIDQKFSD